MRKVALCPCSMTSFPSEVRMCNPRGAFPGHFSILAMYFSLKPSVQLLDTILRYLRSSNKRTLGSDGGQKSSFVLFLLCLSTLMHVFFQRLTACMIPSLEGRLKETQHFIKWVKAKPITIQPSPEILSSIADKRHIVEVNYSALLKGREFLQLSNACRIASYVPAF